jgi:hypothetical protein
MGRIFCRDYEQGLQYNLICGYQQITIARSHLFTGVPVWFKDKHPFQFGPGQLFKLHEAKLSINYKNRNGIKMYNLYMVMA